MNRLLFALGCVSLASVAGCALESQSTQDNSLSTQTQGLVGLQYIWHQIGSGQRAYLDVEGGNTENGTPVWTWSFNGTAAQQWSHVPENGALVNASGKCLDVQWGGTANGTPVQIWDCNGSGAQVWYHAATNSAFRNPNSNRCLDVPNNSPNPTQLQIWDCNDSMAQYWGQAHVE